MFLKKIKKKRRGVCEKKKEREFSFKTESLKKEKKGVGRVAPRPKERVAKKKEKGGGVVNAE